MIRKIKKGQGDRMCWATLATEVHWEDLREGLPANDIFKQSPAWS